ncbi:metallo-beta-lactamase superfamily protein [Pontibacter ummariensis]|uniref:Metallo-beta-lactamase superfamily protein n=1 Tax=Pontibacter ummariensis TaxID=1610492 RepID=A0A239HBZ8_9BACT|nr:MBL fold metallo-hydrolase [Pontibacter ummariensis]PRY10666.1 metallo-beta-lactamase superfamily protein [Pontibacter ummariensis]SNS78691.1 Metallo-beta-lactamase superfamily protein [Pontibacter ummariensis]
MTNINEIAPDLYRISVYVPDFDMQFNHFLILDEEPLLYHTGMRSMFPLLKEALAKVVAPEKLRWIGFSHFEVDECGSLNDWLQIAPHAQGVCSEVGAIVNMSDFAIRPAKGLTRADVLTTGKYSYRFIPTPHLPHGWDAGVMFEEKNKVLLCSDLFHQNGNVTAITDKDIMERVRTSLRAGQQSPLSDYMPYTHKTAGMLKELAALQPTTLATMHGSSYNGNGAQALLDLNLVMKEELGEERLVLES